MVRPQVDGGGQVCPVGGKEAARGVPVRRQGEITLLRSSMAVAAAGNLGENGGLGEVGLYNASSGSEEW